MDVGHVPSDIFLAGHQTEKQGTEPNICYKEWPRDYCSLMHHRICAISLFTDTSMPRSHATLMNTNFVSCVGAALQTGIQYNTQHTETVKYVMDAYVTSPDGQSDTLQMYIYTGRCGHYDSQQVVYLRIRVVYRFTHYKFYDCVCLVCLVWMLISMESMCL